MPTGPRVTWEQSESSSRLETDEYARAASAYLAWPLAFFELMRGTPASLWYRAHLRQAAILGTLCSAVLLLMLAAPLALVFALRGPGDATTIAIYSVAMIADTILFLVLGCLLVWCAIRASRGELFALPLVTPLAQRIFVRRET